MIVPAGEASLAPRLEPCRNMHRLIEGERLCANEPRAFDDVDHAQDERNNPLRLATSLPEIREFACTFTGHTGCRDHANQTDPYKLLHSRWKLQGRCSTRACGVRNLPQLPTAPALLLRPISLPAFPRGRLAIA